MTAGVLIIGGGIAGLECAKALRRQGYSKAISILSAESLLTYDRPALSKSILESEKPDAPALTSHEELQSLGIDFHLNSNVEQVMPSEHRVMVKGGKSFAYSRLILAMGAGPRELPISGAFMPGIHYLRDWTDAVRLRTELDDIENLVVIGAGVIGLEVASTTVASGKRVTVVEKEPVLMSRSLPAPMSHRVQKHLAGKGVCFEFGMGVREFVGVDRISGVRLGNHKIVAGDLVLCSVGAVPRDELARSAGLEVDDGIVVNDCGQTSDPDIFAVGDVARWGVDNGARGLRHETYNDAIEQAQVAASEICGQKSSHPILTTFWSDQLELRVQGAGAPHGDRIIMRETGTEGAASCLVTVADRVVGAFALNAPGDFAALKRCIGWCLTEEICQTIADPGTQLRSVIRELERMKRELA